MSLAQTQPWHERLVVLYVAYRSLHFLWTGLRSPQATELASASGLITYFAESAAKVVIVYLVARALDDRYPTNELNFPIRRMLGVSLVLGVLSMVTFGDGTWNSLAKSSAFWLGALVAAAALARWAATKRVIHLEDPPQADTTPADTLRSPTEWPAEPSTIALVRGALGFDKPPTSESPPDQSHL